MPRPVVKELNALQVSKLSQPGYHRVGGVSGLCLQVKASGARSWVLRLTFGGRRQDLGLGGYPTVTLSMARERARMKLDEAWTGKDPRAERKAALAAATEAARRASQPTFGRAWAAYKAEALDAQRKSQSEVQILEARLTRYAMPTLEQVKVSDVTTDHILTVLRPIWTKKNDTATRLRAGIEDVLNWATFHGYWTGENPARWKGHLDQVLASPSRVKAGLTHHPAVPVSDLPAFLRTLQARDTRSARALEFLILTATRSGETRGATWEEVDLDAGVWIIPASRMKAGKEHRVPLSPAALALLNALPRFAGTRLIFPGQDLRSEQSENTLTKLMRGLHNAQLKLDGKGWVDRQSGRVAVPHGFRSTFRDWAAERGVDRDLAELALAHTVGSAVERAYRRADMFERRQTLMSGWADFALGRSD